MPLDPGSPAVWMRYALSDLQLARTGATPGVLYETLCFHAQQAVEKAIKAVLIALEAVRKVSAPIYWSLFALRRVAFPA